MITRLAISIFFCFSLFSQEEQISRPVIDKTWTQFQSLMNNIDIEGSRSLLEELVRKRDMMGYQSLETYSESLLSELEKPNKLKNELFVAFSLRAAETLSPNSAPVILQSIQYLPAAGRATDIPEFILRYVLVSLSRIDLFVIALTKMYFPMLSSAILAFILTSGLFFVTRSDLIISRVLSRLPFRSEAMAAALILLFLLTPIFIGPLAIVAIWSCFLMLLIPNQLRLAIYGFIILLAASFLTPLQNHVKVWEKTGLLSAIFRIRSYSYSPGDLEKFPVAYPDPALEYHRAQLLKNHGQIDEAERVFNRVLVFPGSIGMYAKAELAGISLLRGKNAAANSAYRQLNNEGLDSAEFLINYSKAAFRLQELDLSSKLYKEALEKDPKLTAKMKSIEESGGDIGVLNIRLPEHLILPLFFQELPDTAHPEGVFYTLIKLKSAWHVFVIEAICFLLLLRSVATRNRRRIGSLYRVDTENILLNKFFNVIPCGLSIKNGYPHVAAKVYFVFFIILWPLIAKLMGKENVILGKVFFITYVIISLCLFIVMGIAVNKTYQTRSR